MSCYILVAKWPHSPEESFDASRSKSYAFHLRNLFVLFHILHTSRIQSLVFYVSCGYVCLYPVWVYEANVRIFLNYKHLLSTRYSMLIDDLNGEGSHWDRKLTIDNGSVQFESVKTPNRLKTLKFKMNRTTKPLKPNR